MNDVTKALEEVGISKVFPKFKSVTVTVESEGPDKLPQYHEEVVVVKELKLSQVQLIARAVAPIAYKLRAVKSPQDIDIPAMLADHGDEVSNFLAAALKKDKAWFDTIGLDDSAELLMTVLEVNLDFFIQRFLPSLLAKAALLTDAVARAQTSRTPSSA